MNVQSLGERDEWICWVCENEVDPNAVAGSAHAGSMDHVVPKSLGGGSDPDNLRLAHRKCNSNRGSKLPELLWPHAEDLIDSAPLWPALLRMTKPQGQGNRGENVAFFTSRDSAEAAASWVIMKATQLTGVPWIVEVEPGTANYGVRLIPAI